MITEECVFCGAKFRVPDALAGHKVRCPKCKETIGISARPADEPQEATHPQVDLVEPDLSPPRPMRLATVVGIVGWVALALCVLAGVAMMLVMSSLLDALDLGAASPLAKICIPVGLAVFCVVLGGVFCALCLFIRRSLDLQAAIVRQLDEIVESGDRILAEFRRVRRTPPRSG